MKKRRAVRILVVYNKTNYFIDKGAPRGLTYDAFKLFEDEINKKYKTGNLKINVVFFPVGRADLAAALLDGRGDIAAANITITPERLEKVDFSDPTRPTCRRSSSRGRRPNPLRASTTFPAGRSSFVRARSSTRASRS